MVVVIGEELGMVLRDGLLVVVLNVVRAEVVVDDVNSVVFETWVVTRLGFLMVV